MGVTIVDIAEKVGVSYTTVSRALNNKKGVSDQVREEIIKVAKEMGYQPNSLARGLVSNSTKTIGFIIPDIINPYFPEVARGFEDAASENGYTVFLTNSNWEIEKEKRCIESMQKNRVDGIAINPNALDNLELLQKLNIPVVYINTKVEGEDISFIGIDNVSGARDATQHLIDCGYEHIGYIGGNLTSFSNNMRRETFIKTMEKNNRTVDKKLVMNGQFSQEFGYDAMMKLLALDNPPDAVFAANDVLALGVYHAVSESGIQVPEDFGIIGFDDIEEARLYHVQLTTMSVPKYYMGQKAFNLLLDRINEDALNVAQYKIKPTLIKRKTTR